MNLVSKMYLILLILKKFEKLFNDIEVLSLH